MILRLCYLVKWWTLLFVFSFSFVSCMLDRMEDVLLLRDELMKLMDISSCITGKQKKVNDNGNIIGEKPFEINFPKAHALFSYVERGLRDYPKITTYKISQSTLEEMHEILSALKQDIESLPDGLEKNQFRKEWNQLAQYISSLMAQKDVSQRSTTPHRPTG